MHLIDGGGADDGTGSRGRTPAFPYFLTEPLRGALSLAALPLAAPLLAQAPRGDGHGVLVLPGLMADDLSTRPMRRFLKLLGYDARGWGLGRNVGPTAAAVAGMPRALNDLVARNGGPVSIIGWSLGGMFGRELARHHADSVRQVITLASPYAMEHDHQSRAGAAFRKNASRHVSDGMPTRSAMREAIPVPSTAVYSKTDGIVDWRACIEESGANHENIQVRAGHLGIGVDPVVMWLIADRLAQLEADWQPFRPPSRFRSFFPESS